VRNHVYRDIWCYVTKMMKQLSERKDCRAKLTTRCIALCRTLRFINLLIYIWFSHNVRCYEILFNPMLIGLSIMCKGKKMKTWTKRKAAYEKSCSSYLFYYNDQNSVTNSCKRIVTTVIWWQSNCITLSMKVSKTQLNFGQPAFSTLPDKIWSQRNTIVISRSEMVEIKGNELNEDESNQLEVYI